MAILYLLNRLDIRIEALTNSMVVAKDMTGNKGVSVKALPHDKPIERMRELKRMLQP